MQNQTTALKPWLTIWVRPKKTIRQIVEANPGQQLIILAVLAGLAQVLNQAAANNAGDFFSLFGILVMGLLAGPVAGIVSLYLGAAIAYWVSTRFGGRASVVELRAAIAWSAVPTIYALILWIPEVALFGPELFTEASPRIEANPSLSFAFTAFGFVEAVIALWAFVLLVQCLGEVCRFSTWQALLTSVVPIFVTAVVASSLVTFLLTFA